MIELTSKQRAYLKGLAMKLDPIFNIGKSSLTPEFTEGISQTFNNKELINNDIKLFIDNKEIDINVRIENEYFVIESDTYSLLDMKEYNDIKYVELFENESKVDLHPIGLETKKYYKE